ncbi:MAG: glutathione transferase GstA [Aquabacterium sp.]|nr:MAG: glutathione transferase GstA [Aquabacterium sp.]
MKLYYSQGVCSLSPNIVLREAGIPFELVEVNYASKKLPDGSDFLQLNPLGYVPLLELDDGQRFTEGPAIVQYLADLKPGSKLAPAAGTLERVRLQEWLGFINSELHKAYSTLFDTSLPAAVKEAVRKKLEGRLDHAAAKLGDRPYVLGEQFSAADAYLYTVLGWSRFTGIELSRWPTLAAFHERVNQRPAVREALKSEGLLK